MSLRRARYWYPVLDPKVFSVGDVIWLDIGEAYGYHEVRVLGHGEILVRHIPWWEVWLRQVRGRWRRFWIRRRRGLPR